MNAPDRTLHTPDRDVPPVRDARELAAWETIRTLVGFDTTSRESNLALIHWVRDYLAGFGIASTLTYDDDRRKANLFATLPARDGNATTGGIVLSGHTDVVPVDGQPWSTDPFAATQVGDRVHGRGVTDMKSFSATGLALVPLFLSRGLSRPLHFALSYDEEVGCIGVRRLIAELPARGVAPAGCIVGEPTGMRLVVAHKGKKSWRCRVRGHEAHSSLTPRGVNAVEIACQIVAHLAAMARRYRDDGRRDDGYDVPYTTVHVGTIRGGTALNIVPRDCTFDFEVRHLPFDDPETMFAEVRDFAARFVPAMQAVAPDTGIAFDALSSLPGFDTHDGSAITALGHALAGAEGVGKVSFGTEASLFHGAAIPTVICGPGHIDQAHQPDEWVSLDQLARCEAFMRRLAARLAAA
ncbi:MAG TPA: acetylornithine deacetylase [Casimicrobiaceae bacterium]|nr:acetylornithine deacetylase [Casimicrobiaceae bacterium]